MIALTFNLNLLEPALASALEGDPNSGTSYPFIPGSLLRGMLIDQYLARPQAVPLEDFATAALTRDLFLNGQTRYLPAYPLFDETYRTLPGLLSWYKEKSSPENYPVYDKAHPDFDPADDFHDLDQPHPLDTQFCYIRKDEEGPVQLIPCSPEMQISIHTQRERRAGRAIETAGAVFQYEALAPGQSFGGVILLANENYLATLAELLAQAGSLGGSHHAGYGRVRVDAIQHHLEWEETGAAPTSLEPGHTFTVALLSDLVIRDPYGQYADTLTAAMLAQALGLAPTALQPQVSYKQNVWVGGFNRKWGLPLPQTLAIRAGSVFSFTPHAPASAEAVTQLLNNGLGERRVEGFGRLAINWPDEPKLYVGEKDKGHKQSSYHFPQLSSLNQPNRRLIQQMNQRLARRDADRELGRAINEFSLLHSPKRSQLGGLRVIIRSALAEKKPEPVETYLSEMKPTARKQFEQGRITRAGYKESLWDWLTMRLKEPGQIWQQLGFDPAQGAKHIGPPEETKDISLAIEYTLRLMDGVLAKAAKAERSN